MDCLYTGTSVCCSSIRQSRGARLKWCREHGNWTVSDWGNVMFVNESRFALEPDDKHIRIWRKQGTRNQPQNNTQHHAFRGQKHYGAGRNRQHSGEIADTLHRRLDDQYRVLPWPEDCTVVVCLHDALYGGTLTPAHRRRCSLWCREHQNWRDNEWGRVLFTDESIFSLSSDSHRIRIWRGSRKPAIIPRTSLKGTEVCECLRCSARLGAHHAW
ncbi:transposable element Tcb1 transposase [Trichonephila clavipes]|nr:transposable element Tcb1 transposase [Trichonephila clavipes]